MGTEQKSVDIKGAFNTLVIFAVLGCGAFYLATHLLTIAVEDALRP